MSCGENQARVLSFLKHFSCFKSKTLTVNFVLMQAGFACFQIRGFSRTVGALCHTERIAVYDSK